MAIEKVPCPDCGAVVLEEITEVGVRPVGGDRIIPFRRTTDYVVCPRCMLTISVTDLISREVRDRRDSTDAQVIDLIERLERMADQPAAETDEQQPH